MADTAAAFFGDRVRGGLIAAPATGGPLPPFTRIESGHPAPTEASVHAGRRALALAESVGRDETLIVLLSGGASALLEAPAAGIALDDVRATADVLMRRGADIHELNTVRRHLSDVKGGWLAARVAAPTVTFAISDVVGDEPSDIGSGPSVGDPTTFADARRVLERFGGVQAYPPAVVRRLAQGESGALPETPKPDDPRLARAAWRLIGSRRDAMAGAVAEAAARGYWTELVDEALVGEARDAGAAIVGAAMAGPPRPRPACMVRSGETTVHVTGGGRGGRNQELALAAAIRIADAGVPMTVASVGTDGVDGPTDAAGALADETTLSRGRAAGVAAAELLRQNNAYAFFDAVDDLIRTGPTDTNVGDLQVILLA